MSYAEVALTNFGGPETLELKTVVSLPEPGPGEARVRVLVTSAAFTDVIIRRGMYPDVKEKPPFDLGYDLLGVVDTLGTGVAGWSLGDRVADLTTIGAYSEYICLPAERLTRVPDGVADEDALAMILSRSLSALKPGGMVPAFGFQNEVLGPGGSIPLVFVQLKLWDWLPNGHATACYSIGAMRRTHPDWFRQDLSTLFDMLAKGRIDPIVAEVVPLLDVRRAHERVEAGEVQGKLVLRVNER